MDELAEIEPNQQMNLAAWFSQQTTILPDGSWINEAKLNWSEVQLRLINPLPAALVWIGAIHLISIQLQFQKWINQAKKLAWINEFHEKKFWINEINE